MEIYRQTTNVVTFEAPEATTPVTVTASLNGGDPISLPLISGTENEKVKKVQLPYINDEGTVVVNWSFTTQTFAGTETVTVRDTYDVVTPILSDAEIKAIHPNATPGEITRIEKATRHIINAHTGQRFGRFVGTHEVRGSGSYALQLPARLQSLTDVNGATNANLYFQIDGDGYVLHHFPYGVPPVKADYYGLHMHVGGVIHNPNHVKWADFNKNMVYKINGVWGWDEVPAQVREAAKLLINDYACADTNYRDRYLTSMTAADWRIQFHSGAFLKTGNVRADQLLNDFVLKRGWAVI